MFIGLHGIFFILCFFFKILLVFLMSKITQITCRNPIEVMPNNFNISWSKTLLK